MNFIFLICSLFSIFCFADHSKKIGMMQVKDVDNSLKPAFIQKIQRLSKYTCFVETGTFLGESTEKASRCFPHVYTIELSEILYEKAKNRFEKNRNIYCYLGDSKNIFDLLLPQIPADAVFYLDGHASGGITAKGEQFTPIWEELSMIQKYNLTDSLIMIDDIRFFQDSSRPLLANEGYPDLSVLLEKLRQINPDYQFAFIQDMLIAFPPKLKAEFTPVLEACSYQRILGLENVRSDPSNQVIAKANKAELRAIFSLQEKFAADELDRGWRSYGAYWAGLCLIEMGCQTEGEYLIEIALLTIKRPHKTE